MIPSSSIPTSTSTPCQCCDTLASTSPSSIQIPNLEESVTTEPPLIITTSEFSIKLKEIIILSLIFLLLVYSIVTFLNKWSKSYRQINQIPFYSSEHEDQLSGVLPPLPWDEDDLSRTGSSMSRVAKSAMEKYRQTQSCTYDDPPPYRMSHPRKSLSTSNLFNKSQVPKKVHLLKPQNSDPENQKYCNFKEEFSVPNGSFECIHLNPSVSIYENDSHLPVPSFHRHYLKYHTKCQDSPMHSLDSNTNKRLLPQDIFSQHSKSNLQIRHFREDDGSFSFSDLDPVEEALEKEEKS